jgi:hypothetical protein
MQKEEYMIWTVIKVILIIIGFKLITVLFDRLDDFGENGILFRKKKGDKEK